MCQTHLSQLFLNNWIEKLVSNLSSADLPATSLNGTTGMSTLPLPFTLHRNFSLTVTIL